MTGPATSTDTPRRVIGYVRVSTADQAVSGLGLEAQRATIEAAVLARDWELISWAQDAGLSGGLPPAQRPALTEAIAQLCDHEADVLITAKLDRLSRSTRDVLDLLDRAEHCRFDLLALDSNVDTTTAAGRLVTTVLSGVAEWEKRVIIERTKAALAAKKAAGARLGRPVTLPQELRHRVGELRSQGRSIAATADALNAEGRRQGNGAAWTRSAVQRVLRSLSLDGDEA